MVDDLDVDEQLEQLRNYARLMRDHADKLYELVPKANPKEASFHPDNKDKNKAGWHGHEINKYHRMIGYKIEKIREKLANCRLGRTDEPTAGNPGGTEGV